MTLILITEHHLPADGRACRFASAFAEAGEQILGAGFRSGPRTAPASNTNPFAAIYEQDPPSESRWRAPLTAMVHAPAGLFFPWTGLLAEIAHWAVPHRKTFREGLFRWLDAHEDKPSLVIAKHWTAGPLAQAVAQRFGARLVYDANELAVAEHDHDWRWRLAMQPAITALERRLIETADCVVTVCDGYAEAIQQTHQLATRPVVIRNLPVADAISPKPLGETRSFVFCGLARPDRKIETLVESVALWEPHNRLVLQLVGLPVHVQAIRDHVTALKLADRIVFREPVPQDQLVGSLTVDDVGLSILPQGSRQTQLLEPNKLYQYLQAGLPVITSPLAASARLIEAFGAGTVLSDNTPQTIAQAVNSWTQADQAKAGLGVARFQKQTEWAQERTRLLEACAPSKA